MKPIDPIYFSTPGEWREWLEKNHTKASEVIVGYHKRATGRPSLTWSESVDEALCFGWIDGIRRSIDGERYCIRFTPRNPRSVWSRINVEKVAVLISSGRMRPAGLRAYENLQANNSKIYSYEQPTAKLGATQLKRLRANPKAWAYFQTLPASYVRRISWWVMQARRPETQERRIATLVKACEEGVRLDGWNRKT